MGRDGEEVWAGRGAGWAGGGEVGREGKGSSCGQGGGGEVGRGGGQGRGVEGWAGRGRGGSCAVQGQVLPLLKLQQLNPPNNAIQNILPR